MSEQDPIGVARKAWPGLDWDELGAGVGVIASEPYTDRMLAFHPDPDGDGWTMWVSSTQREEKVGEDLHAAINEARRSTLERLEKAAERCREGDSPTHESIESILDKPCCPECLTVADRVTAPRDCVDVPDQPEEGCILSVWEDGASTEEWPDHYPPREWSFGCSCGFEDHGQPEDQWYTVRRLTPPVVLALLEQDEGPTREDLAEVIRLMAREGHTKHCAKGIAYSGQECGCGRPRAPESHTMAPLLGGFKMDAQARLWSDLFLLVEAGEDYRSVDNVGSGWEEQVTVGGRFDKRLQHAAQTLERTKGKTPVPVYVAESGEAVLMLTSSNQGHVIPIPVRLIVGGVEGVGPMYKGQSSPSRVRTEDRIYIVSETVEDIKATLVMLADHGGGGE